jgi:Bacterial SH3 domain
MVNHPKSLEEMNHLQDSLKDYRAAIKTLDVMKDYRESMKVLDVMKDYRESIKTLRLQDPMMEFRESMKALQFPDMSKALLESMKAPQIPDMNKTFIESMKALQLPDPMKDYRESLKVLQFPDINKALLESMKAPQIPDLNKELLESMRALQFPDPMKQFREAMRNLGVDQILSNMSRDKWPEAYEDASGKIVVNGNDSLTIASTTVSYAEVQDIATRIVANASAQSVQHVEEAVARIVTEIQGLKTSPLKQILTWLIFPIIVALIMSLVTPMVSFHVNAYLNADRRKLEKDIKKQAVATVVDASQLKALRFVSSDRLAVRKKPSGKSPTLGVLHFGHLVVLLERDRSWARVAWSDEDNGLQLQGWVYARYLKKFE